MQRKKTCLEAFGHGITPELLKLCDFVEDGINNDETEVAVVNLSLEALQKTHLVRCFHCSIIVVLHHLSQVSHQGSVTLHHPSQVSQASCRKLLYLNFLNPVNVKTDPLPFVKMPNF